MGERRVVTLTGPGGIGKTRLAIEVAGRVRGSFPDGIVWIDLSPVDDPALLLPEVARALGVMSTPADQLLEVIGRALARRQALLVLDNCELVAPAVAELVAAVLPDAPLLRVLVTSRVPLHLSAEVRWPVPGLSWTVGNALGEDALPEERAIPCRAPSPTLCACSPTGRAPWVRQPGWSQATSLRPLSCAGALTGCRWPSRWQPAARTCCRWLSCWTRSATRPSSCAARWWMSLVGTGRWRRPWTGATSSWPRPNGMPSTVPLPSWARSTSTPRLPSPAAPTTLWHRPTS